MKRFLTYSLAALALATLIAFAGCSSDKTPTGGGGQPGDLDDPNYLAVQNLLEAANVYDNWEISFELTIGLLERTLLSPASERRWSRPQATAAQDFVIDSVTAYEYDPTSGWHIWEVYFTVDVDGGIYDGYAIDSLRIWKDGEALSGEEISGTEGFDDIDSLQIGNFIVMEHQEEECTFGGNHSFTVTAIPYGKGDVALVFNGSTDEEFEAGIGCLDENCTVSVNSTVTLVGLTYPPGFDDILADCPIAGGLSLSTVIAVECEGTSTSGLGDLDINGMWDFSAVVETNGDISTTLSDGTTVWTDTFNCEE